MTALHTRLSQVQSTNPYFPKDLAKSRNATKFIGRGSLESSTNKYRVAAGDLANCGQYSSDDVVFVSAEGNRRGRLPADLQELACAVAAAVTFVTDTAADRNRPYNRGEREVAEFLTSQGYADNGQGVWKKTAARSEGITADLFS